MVEGSFMLENASWPVVLTDGQGIILLVNQPAELAFGLIIEGKTSLAESFWASENSVTVPQFLENVAVAQRTGVTVKLRIKSGEIQEFHVCGFPILWQGRKCHVLQLFDGKMSVSPPSPPAFGTTGTAATECHLNQKQRLDCALQLIRTVVLDFNNALTSILGHTSLVLAKMEMDHPWHSSLVEVEKSAEKAAEIASDLAAFSRQDRETRSLEAGNLNDLLRRTAELFQTPKQPKLNWSLRLESKLYAVNFDEAKMQQALMKILDNSIQAVAEGGRIAILTRNLDVQESWSDGNVALTPGHYVCIEILDDGCGIVPEALPRIFEPFYTTKANHRGLGLAWVYGIVTNHGGSVAVSSRPGQGTSVRVYLPATKRILKDQTFNTEDLMGVETILIVDDEDLLLTMGQMVLSSFGYNVLTASSGERAIEIISQQSTQIDLVITDLVMPSMSGRELMDRLKSMAPHVKILCSSGYVRPASHEESEIYLQKPFTSQDLLRKVKQALS
ncbi:MAG TPA: ATP-binding protein [Candidatus Paceibacterota bacterium]|nr:ATP-binding protein [Candidatus Paceibacterota bacterium]